MTSRRADLTLLAVLGSLTAVGPLSVDMYLPAFPQIADDFGDRTRRTGDHHRVKHEGRQLAADLLDERLGLHLARRKP